MKDCLHIASCSCGKDSLAMLQIIKRNPEKYPLDEIVICDIKFSKELSGIFKPMQDFIEGIIDRLRKEFNVPVTRVSSDKTFEEWFYTIKGKGANKGSIYGFPYTLGAWCNDRLKMKPLDAYFRKKGKCIRYIGIAYDEPQRYEKLEENEVAPLYEEKVVEAEAMKICEETDYRSPIYDYFDRDGCWFCPKQCLHSLRVIFDHFNEYWQILLKLQKDSPVDFKPKYNLIDLDKKFKEGFKPKKIKRKTKMGGLCGGL